MAAGGFGAVLMNGVKRGLFSNEAGSGSAPCAAAAAECDKPVKGGIYTGTWGVCRYDRDLQLYGHDHAYWHRKNWWLEKKEWIFYRQR